MKILHVCGSFPPAYAYGGPPRSVDNLTSALAERGHEVTVFTTDAKDEENRVNIDEYQTNESTVNVRRFRNVSNRLAWQNIQFPPKMFFALLQEASKFDIIHSHEFRSPPTVFAYLAAQREGIPHVHQPRGSIPRFERSWAKQSFDRLIGGRIIQATDKIITSSQIESSECLDVFPHLKADTISQIPNGLSTERYQNLPEGGEFRRAYDIGPEEIIILFLSRLHHRKGGDMLIKAVSELSADNISLVFVGPDEGARKDWESLASQEGIKQQTLFTGPLYSEKKLSAYVDADIFVLPSKNKYESFGNVVVEAMACGTPAVTTNVCGVSDWLEHDACISVQPTSDALQNGIQTVLTRSSFSPKALREYVWQNFTWVAVASETEEVYEDLVV